MQPVKPQPGQESVWDYPRPPRLEAMPERVRVVFNGVTIADSTSAMRVLETSHPPTVYIPPQDVTPGYLRSSTLSSFCEWKGMAGYYSLDVGGQQSEDAAWFYASPTPAFALLKDFLAFYPSRVESCFVNDEPVVPQPGDFYGGWAWSKIVGPFKGAPGTRGW